jgi:cell wall-associated NlpC family hydrolase
MSPRISGLLRPALNRTLSTVMAAGLTGAVMFGGTPSGDASGSPAEHTAPAITLSAATTDTTATTDGVRRHRDWRARVLRVAKAQTGDRYVYGAAGPNAFDCSGLTSYVYRVATHKRLPHSSSAQRGRTHRISAGAARPGDLVFFYGRSGVYHVAIYAGHHTVIHAPYPGQRVKRERIWTSSVSYGRVS